MDFALSAEDRAFAERLRAFFTSEIPAGIRERVGRGEDATREDIVTSQRILNAHGLAVPNWPVEWGGQDWTPMQRHLWAQGFSEPNAGSDLASLRTTAVRDGGAYIVNGQKTWTTLAQYADWIFCLVRTDPAAQEQRGISMLLIDLASPGVTVRPIRLIDGGSEVNEVFFDNVRVPADQLVGEENRGWTFGKFLLGNERTSNAGLGIIKTRISRLKRLSGALLDEQPLLRARLARLEAETQAQALEMSVLRTLAREGSLPPGQPDPGSSVLKLRGSQLQQDASELLVDVLGPEALPYRDARSLADLTQALPEGVHLRGVKRGTALHHREVHPVVRRGVDHGT